MSCALLLVFWKPMVMHTNQKADSPNGNLTSIRDGARGRYRIFTFLVSSTGKSVWRWLRNRIKVLIGRKPYFNEERLFLRQCVLHLAGLRPMRKITCTGHSGEGAGSQALMVMNAINFARFFGLTYLHTPFTHIHHADRPMQEWVTAWEELFNLGAGETVCGMNRHEAVNYSHNFPGLDLIFGSYSRNHNLAESFKALIPEFRRKYYLKKSPRVTDEVTVAVHIRRGDALPDNPDYFTSNESILRTITAVKSVLDTHKVEHKIRAYSQGDVADFAEFSRLGVELFLDVDAVWTMQELIEADVLVVAKGCFSYYAALISDGIKILEPIPLTGNDYLSSWKWRSVPLTDSWIPCLADGSFDSAAFERQLFLAIEGKSVAAAKTSSGSRECSSDQESSFLK
jgi:hypothetical protein